MQCFHDPTCATIHNDCERSTTRLEVVILSLDVDKKKLSSDTQPPSYYSRHNKTQSCYSKILNQHGPHKTIQNKTKTVSNKHKPGLDVYKRQPNQLKPNSKFKPLAIPAKISRLKHRGSRYKPVCSDTICNIPDPGYYCIGKLILRVRKKKSDSQN